MSAVDLDGWLADPRSGPYWAALQDGRLVTPRCRSCGHRTSYLRWVCPACGARGEAEWAETSGVGRVHSVTTQHRAPADFDLEPPYQVALVALDDGPLVLAPVPPGAVVAIGDTVRVTTRDVPGLGRLISVGPRS
jgi:uncharacterized OB-fold protein